MANILQSIVSKVPASLGTILGKEIERQIEGNPTSQTSKQPRQFQKEALDDHVWTVQELMTDLRFRGIAKTNRFAVIFSAPKQFREDWLFDKVSLEHTPSNLNGMMGNEKYIYASCESAQIPGGNFQTQDIKSYSVMTKFPVMYLHDDVSMTFRVDSAMLERKFFERWMQSIHNRQTGNLSYFSDYTSNIEIIQMDNENRGVYGVMLVNAYPFNIASMEVSNADRDSYHRVTVQWACEKVLPLGSYDDSNYGDISGNSGKPTKNKTPYEQALEELKKLGVGVITEKIIKKIPVGNIPGIGSVTSVAKKIFNL